MRHGLWAAVVGISETSTFRFRGELWPSGRRTLLAPGLAGSVCVCSRPPAPGGEVLHARTRRQAPHPVQATGEGGGAAGRMMVRGAEPMNHAVQQQLRSRRDCRHALPRRQLDDSVVGDSLASRRRSPSSALGQEAGRASRRVGHSPRGRSATRPISPARLHRDAFVLTQGTSRIVVVAPTSAGGGRFRAVVAGVFLESSAFWVGDRDAALTPTDRDCGGVRE